VASVAAATMHAIGGQRIRAAIIAPVSDYVAASDCIGGALQGSSEPRPAHPLIVHLPSRSARWRAGGWDLPQ
jgi:hypothetical protein